MENKLRPPFAIWKVKGEEYKLKLKTDEIERLERTYQTGNIMNPAIQTQAGQIPSLVYMLDVIHGAFQKFHHGYSRNDISDLYDDYIEEGGSQMDLLKVLMEVFRASGFFPKESVKKGKVKEDTLQE